MICKELNKEFTTKAEMFKALKANVADIISIKCKALQKSFEKGLGVNAKSIDVTKLGTTSKGILTDDNYYYIAVNTTKILDSHSDLHIDGIWNKTVNEQQGKNYLVTDHKMELANVVAKKENIEMLLAEIPFSSIGKSYAGNTQALIYKVAKEHIINPLAKEWLESGSDIEASVRMQYVNIKLALDSDAKEDVKEKENFDNHINTIANKDDFESIDYFWVVTEAKNIGESSLVLRGSNGATGVLDNKNIEPLKDTQTLEPSADDTQKTTTDKVSSSQLFNFYKNL